MALLIIVLSVLLMVGGAVYILLGFDIVMTERGNAMTLGGVIALSSGVIGLGIGFALLRLSQILGVLETGVPRLAEAPAEPPPVAEYVSQEPPGTAVVAAGAAAAAGTAAAATAASTLAQPDAAPSEDAIPHRPLEREALAEIDSLLADPIERPPAVAQPIEPPPVEPEPSVPKRPGRLDFLLRRKRAAIPEPVVEPPPEAAPAGDADSTADPPGNGEPEPPEAAAPALGAGSLPEEASDVPDGTASEAAPVAAPAALPAAPAGRAVLGSYRAGGRTYTMFSDGSVEAMTEDGVERFESMDALRAHLAKT